MVIRSGIYMLSVDKTLWQFSWKNIIAYNSWKKEVIATKCLPDIQSVPISNTSKFHVIRIIVLGNIQG